MSEQQSPEKDAPQLAPCGQPYAEPPDEPIAAGDYHYFNGLTHCSCGRWVRPGEHVIPPGVPTSPTVATEGGGGAR